MSIIASTMFLILIAGFVYLLYSVDGEPIEQEQPDTFVCRDCSEELPKYKESRWERMCEHCAHQLM